MWGTFSDLESPTLLFTSIMSVRERIEAICWPRLVTQWLLNRRHGRLSTSAKRLDQDYKWRAIVKYANEIRLASSLSARDAHRNVAFAC